MLSQSAELKSSALPSLSLLSRASTPLTRSAARGAFALVMLVASVAAAESKTAQIAQGASMFEAHLVEKSFSKEANWPAQRDAWRRACAAAKTPADVAKLVKELESALDWGAVDGEWQNARDGWDQRVTAARTDAVVAAALLELESHTIWEAVDKGWESAREKWVSGLVAAGASKGTGKTKERARKGPPKPSDEHPPLAD